MIGSLATLATLPFALTLGIAAGYFRGWVDDVIQYVYTTISSIPSVLLIAASVLMVQVFLDKHPELYQTSLERADLRLMLLAVIIGMTGWATLARLLRAETMKLSTLDFVSAAKALGTAAPETETASGEAFCGDAAPYSAQCDAHRPDRYGARLFRHCAL